MTFPGRMAAARRSSYRVSSPQSSSQQESPEITRRRTAGKNSYDGKLVCDTQTVVTSLTKTDNVENVVR